MCGAVKWMHAWMDFDMLTTETGSACCPAIPANVAACGLHVDGLSPLMRSQEILPMAALFVLVLPVENSYPQLMGV